MNTRVRSPRCTKSTSCRSRSRRSKSKRREPRSRGPALLRGCDWGESTLAADSKAMANHVRRRGRGIDKVKAMGKITGFMELERVQEPALPVPERVRHHREFILRLADADASKQGARCMDCGIPF